MTQPPNPGQPFYQQQPSAPSAPAYLTVLFVIRLFIELVSNSAKTNQQI